MKTLKRGFTLVELLIVIALLGALAVGLLAALDPFEQLKKGTDTGVRNTVAEVHASVIRFNSVKGQMPWCDPAVSPPTDASCPNPISDASITPTKVTGTEFNTTSYNTAIDQVVNAGELKGDFVTIAGTQLDKIYITGDSGLGANSPSIAVCFKPQSKSFQADKNTKYFADGSLATECKSAGGANDCFYCVK